MTQQFKFGDHVRYKDNENPVFGVVLEEANPRNGLITVQFIDGAEPELVGSDDLECIPHPDTVRLDWIGKQRATLYHNACEDIKHGIAPVEVRAAAQSEYFGGSTVRQAIDTAMREKSA